MMSTPRCAVDQIAQTPIVDGHVVGGGQAEPLRRIGLVEGHLARREGIGDVEQAQALGEPRERNDGALEALGGLMAAHDRRLRRAVRIEALHLEGRDRHRPALVGDVVDPGEGGRRRPELGHVLVRDHHHLAALSASAESADRYASGAEKPARCCRSRCASASTCRRCRGCDNRGASSSRTDGRPCAAGGGSAARGPPPRGWSRRPPSTAPGSTSAPLPRAGRILEVEDHHDVADVALGGRRDVGVAAVEIEAVHALAEGAPLAEELRAGRRRHIVDAETAAEIRSPP